jgi:hypothetical protein
VRNKYIMLTQRYRQDINYGLVNLRGPAPQSSKPFSQKIGLGGGIPSTDMLHIGANVLERINPYQAASMQPMSDPIPPIPGPSVYTQLDIKEKPFIYDLPPKKNPTVGKTLTEILKTIQDIERSTTKTVVPGTGPPSYYHTAEPEPVNINVVPGRQPPPLEVPTSPSSYGSPMEISSPNNVTPAQFEKLIHLSGPSAAIRSEFLDNQPGPSGRASVGRAVDNSFDQTQNTNVDSLIRQDEDLSHISGRHERKSKPSLRVVPGLAPEHRIHLSPATTIGDSFDERTMPTPELGMKRKRITPKPSKEKKIKRPDYSPGPQLGEKRKSSATVKSSKKLKPN